MSDPISRLLEAIEAKEQKARAVPEHLRAERWTHPGPWVMHGIESRSGDEVALVRMTGRMAEAIAEHIADNDPSSVLRRCEADRKLVELHGIVHRDIGWLEWDEGEHAEMYAELPACGLCVPRHSSFPRREDVLEGPCRTVQLIAEGYGITEEEK